MISKYILGFIVLFSCAACEEIINSALECSIKDVKLENKELRIGAIGRNYYETISVNVKNDPNDDYYQYSFYLDGQLQKGLQFYSEGNKFIITGVPEVAGTVNFQLSVEVTLDEEALGLCTETEKSAYTLTVNER
ncbi:MAG: hypothetical protein U5K51_00550 [Flavobacteriaceae bacterium]|nr:hypothetical protein [Flavobacteriaceae bacterium]